MKEKILLAGGTGLIGTKLIPFLVSHGFDITILSRSGHNTMNEGILKWDPKGQLIPKSTLKGHQHVINLAGANISKGYWTAARKNKIISSRKDSVECFYQSTITANHQFKTFINASAVGYYGDCGDRRLSEENPAGTDFLARVCSIWERSAQKMNNLAETNIQLRIGVVFTDQGGFWSSIKKGIVFRLAAIPGSGSQYVSWIHIDDLCELILLALQSKIRSGPINACSPNPVTFKELINSYAKISKTRYLMIKMPSWIFKIILGEKAKIILGSQRAFPKFLEGSTNFKFKYADIKRTISSMI